MGREKRCNSFCRTFLLYWQEMPAGSSPLGKIRIEWFRWHYWFGNEFSYFPATSFFLLWEDWCSARLTLLSDFIPRAKNHTVELVTLFEYRTDFQPTCPHCFTCPLPLIWPAQKREAVHMQTVDDTYGHACHAVLGGCQDVICVQSSASLPAPEPGPWQKCGFSPMIQTMTYSLSVVSGP